MKTKYFLSLIISVCLLSPNLIGQKLNYKISENALRMFTLENYKRAKELYRELYKKNYNNLKNKYRYGVCLVYTYNTKDAIHLLNGVTKYSGTPSDVWFHLAKAHHLENNFEKAKEYYQKYIDAPLPNYPLVERAKRNIDMCENAKLLMQDSLSIEFINMGESINSTHDEYLPLITPNEDKLIFTTRREGTTGRIYDLESYYTADIYYSRLKSGLWSKSKSIGTPNSYGNEQTAGISENGKYIFYYVNNPKSKNNLQRSEKSRSSYAAPSKIDDRKINHGNDEQCSATLSNDGNYLIFSSNRNGGIGKTDLYISKKIIEEGKSNGEAKWDEPINLGEIINTPFDDAYPYLINNGSTLLFASKGHNSMGGYDIFYCDIDLETLKCSKPKNLGYPINDTDDNTNICFSEDKKHGYVSSYRKEGKGNLDIYKVILNNELSNLFTEEDESAAKN